MKKDTVKGIRLVYGIVLSVFAVIVGICLIAACIGGSAFGDTTSMLSDMVVQSSTGAGCDVVELGKAQFGIKSIMAAVVGVVYLIVGFIV